LAARAPGDVATKTLATATTISTSRRPHRDGPTCRTLTPKSRTDIENQPPSDSRRSPFAPPHGGPVPSAFARRRTRRGGQSRRIPHYHPLGSASTALCPFEAASSARPGGG